MVKVLGIQLLECSSGGRAYLEARFDNGRWLPKSPRPTDPDLLKPLILGAKFDYHSKLRIVCAEREFARVLADVLRDEFSEIEYARLSHPGMEIETL